MKSAAYLLTPDGASPQRVIRDWTLPKMYEVIQCRIVQHLALGQTGSLWIDEEGKFAADALVNVQATRLAHRHRAIFPDDVIVGRALVTGDADGEIAKCPDWLLDQVAMLALEGGHALNVYLDDLPA